MNRPPAQNTPKIHRPHAILCPWCRAGRLHRRHPARRPHPEPRHSRRGCVVVRQKNRGFQLSVISLDGIVLITKPARNYQCIHIPGYIAPQSGESTCGEDNCVQWIPASRVDAFNAARGPASEPAVRLVCFCLLFLLRGALINPLYLDDDARREP